MGKYKGSHEKKNPDGLEVIGCEGELFQADSITTSKQQLTGATGGTHPPDFSEIASNTERETKKQQ